MSDGIRLYFGCPYSAARNFIKFLDYAHVHDFLKTKGKVVNENTL